jgi:TPP-dependent 2-oxoacid decarboxylase
MQTTIGRYLVERLEQAGVRHAFGVPGDYVLDLMDLIVASPIRLINTCNEVNAGYAADGYARANGIGAAIVTYGVGGLNALNAVAGAYAERVPLVVVSGAPHTRMQHNHVLMHHLVDHYDLQRELYEKVTVCAVTLDDPRLAPEQIDKALSACLRRKRPVYIEVPVDFVNQPCEAPAQPSFDITTKSDPETLAEAVREAQEWLSRASSPAVLVGMEVRRFHLQDHLLALLEKAGYPVATTIGGKTALAETHEHYVGVYQGGFTSGRAHDLIEGADCLLCLGAWMTDITTGGFTAHLDANRMISAHSDKVNIHHHTYDGIFLGDFMAELTRAVSAVPIGRHAHSEVPYRTIRPYVPKKETKITAARFFERMGGFLEAGQNVVCDTGDVMFGATELLFNQVEGFTSQDFYLSIGYSLPAALGAGLAVPQRRPVVFIGDGAFQMTAQELGTFKRAGVHPIVFVLNNDGYVIERLIHDGPYNDIARWDYSKLSGALDAGNGVAVGTEGELEEALALAAEASDKLVLIEVRVDRHDATETLSRVAENIRNLSHKKK